MESYAFNYKPQKQVFGRQFYYDGIHDFEYWELNHPGVDYKEYWSIRNAFVERNFNIVESLTSDISNAPIKDIANFTAGMSDDLRIAQTISSKKAWESVRDITNGTGTVMSIDLETIGDITTKHVNVNVIQKSIQEVLYENCKIFVWNICSNYNWICDSGRMFFAQRISEWQKYLSGISGTLVSGGSRSKQNTDRSTGNTGRQ